MSPAFLDGEGELPALMRSRDWSDCTLGDPAHWPASLQSIVALMLANRQLMFVAWGPELAFLYNDGYRPALGRKHPGALGRPFREVWSEIWADIEPLVRKAVAGESTAFENLHLVIDRNGFPEDAWFTFSYSPVRDESGGVAGVFCTGIETTAQVQGERALRESEARTAGVLEGMGEAFYLMDRDFRILTINAEALRLEQRPASHIVGKTHWQAWPDSEPSAVGQRFKRAMALREPVSHEVHHTYPDGRDAWFEMRAYPSPGGLAVFYREVTDRKRAEFALQQLNETLEMHVESRTAERDRLWDLSEDLLVSADYEGRLLRVSPSWTRLLGHDMATLLARPYTEIVHPDDMPAVARALAAMQEGRRAAQFDDRVLAADGSWRWFAWTLAPDPGGVTLHGVGRDITAVKERAAAARRLSHERFFAAVDTAGTQMGAVLRATNWSITPFGAPEGWPTTLRTALGIALNSAFPVCIYWGPEFRLLYNDAFSPILGAKHPAAFGYAAREVWSEIWDVLDPMFHGVVTSGRAVHTVDGLLPMQRNGFVEECYFNYNVSPIYGEDGCIAGLFNSVIETTYRVVAERRARLLRALADRGATARTVVEACAHAAATTRSDPADLPFCLFYFIDPADPSTAWLAASTGVPTGGPASPARIDLSDPEGFWPVHAAARESRLVAVGDFAVRHGEPLVLAPWPEPIATAFVAPIPDIARPDTLAGFMVAGASPRQPFDDAYRGFVKVAAGHVATAIGNARAFEAEKRAAEELERRVAERSAELERTQDALRQAQKMDAVGQLTGGIAHDFNNFLAGIVGSLELMRVRLARGQTDNLERHITAAMASARRAAALTHRLLAFSRRQPLDPRPVDANQLATSMEELLRRTIGPAHALEVATATGLWTTLCDPNQLESAILNLAINARDAMHGGGRLTIATANAQLDEADAAAPGDVAVGQYVTVSITDTGTGMTPEVIARATEPFFTTKPLGEGTGLGLSMVYGFAKQSEGHFRIDSEVGRGTTVRIYLPRHHGAIEPEVPAAAVARAGPSLSSGETVLVVEDEPVIRDLIVELVHDLGFRALAAADGPAGLKVLQSPEPIDLLVTDVGLPGLDGRQLADQARLTRPTLKVLFITGYAMSATLANGFLDHRMALLTKPFEVQALADKIEAMLRAR